MWTGSAWRPWWNGAAAPKRWNGPLPLVAEAVQWRTIAPGMEVGLLRLSGEREAWRFNVALVRLDPTEFELALHVERSPDGRARPWTADDIPDGASLALNAGMFDAVGPWGWIVLDGVERQPPGSGALSSALVIDSAGHARIIPADSIPRERQDRPPRWAVQSYPTALQGDGEVPIPLQGSRRGVNVEHRDARLAVATLRDGRLLVALTRFDALGGALDVIPFGPTLPEMAAILGAVGAQRALFLDGGISAQMAVRDERGELRTWSGLRSVPLALVARRRRAQYFIR